MARKEDRRGQRAREDLRGALWSLIPERGERSCRTSSFRARWAVQVSMHISINKEDLLVSGFDGADATLSGVNDPGYLSTIRARKPSAGNQQIEQSWHAYRLKFGEELQPRSEMPDVQVIETMVARDGVEPPTPAFSGLVYVVV